MFTGIIETIGKIKAVRSNAGGKEFDIQATFISEIEVDDSISTSGVCLTVVKKNDKIYTVQAVKETLRKTNLDDLKTGSSVNLERCLTPNSRLDGHIVQGHVDTTGTISAIEKDGSNYLVTISFDASFADLVVGRGSIAVDGISLTIARLEKTSFTLAIIPYTWQHTTLNQRKTGDKVNLEFDILGKYVLRYFQNRNMDKEKLTIDKLLSSGF